ncbi:hypothetical protein [Actinoallomurus rhizosphaericola]|uniref:hypothetical protein n=1 Tax=Actinoallomurus rhizosphaericola TaxID=2952536 RepID=UPI002093CA6A|nr:hypothetical protein [Actinoallomurus rhizosphaericola]MCO5996210.1 hypothetical protein [Actinoallomurus rhizosphaericola]
MLSGAVGAVLLVGLAAMALLPSVPALARPLAPALALGTPAFCLAALLARLDRAARAVVAGIGAVVLNTAVAEVMLVCSIWSPRGGLIAIAAICAPIAALAIGHRNNDGSPESRLLRETDPDDDDESWAFDR